MDKLKALQYFIAAAQEGSFSGAARRLDVSVPAIAKLIGALERELGANLLDRSTQGLRLTARGSAYLEACAPLLDELADADRLAAAAETDTPRRLAVGAPALFTRLHLIPALARFHDRHPHARIELRAIDHLKVTEAQAQGLDVLLIHGWPSTGEMIQRRLAQSRLIVCGSPAYWKRHGLPLRPRELAAHQCLLVRSPEGVLLDFWRHQRDGETEEVAVSGWLTSENRDHVLQAVLDGQGFGRFADLAVWPHVKEGRLQPVLTDWDSRDAPPFSALYRPTARRDPLLQAFIAFAEELFSQLEAECRQAIGARPAATRPGWCEQRQGRASMARTKPVSHG